MILRNDNGQFVEDENHAELLSNIGSVSAVVWTDLLGDHHPELVLACDPGLIRVYRNITGSLREVTAELGLGIVLVFGTASLPATSTETATWTWLLATSGQTRRMSFTASPGITWHHGDLSGGGVHEVFESYNGARPAKDLPVKSFTEVLRAIPFLRELIPRIPPMRTPPHRTF